MDYIVLGQVPGTSLEIGFIGYLILFDLSLTYYILKKYHPNKLAWLKKKISRKLIHIRDDVLGPKLKFLK